MEEEHSRHPHDVDLHPGGGGGGGGGGGEASSTSEGEHGVSVTFLPSSAPAAASPSPPPPPLAALSMQASHGDLAEGEGKKLRTSPPPPPPPPPLATLPPAVVTRSEMEFLRRYFASIMEEAFLSLDARLQSSEEGQRGDFNTVGCTACVVGITRNFILSANVGDSCAALYNSNDVEWLIHRHRLSDPVEQARIRRAGYSICPNNGRIEGVLAVPRALGDFDFKQTGGIPASEQAVCAVPEVSIRPVPSEGNGHWGVLVACDGVWDTMTLHQIHFALTHADNDPLVAERVAAAVMKGRRLAMSVKRRERRRNEKRASKVQPPGKDVGHVGGTPSTKKEEEEEEEEHGGAVPESENRTTPKGGKGNAVAAEASVFPSENLDEGEDEDEEEEDLYRGARRGRRCKPPPMSSHMNIPLFGAAASIFAQSVAPEDNTEGIGLDNCSLIIIQNQPVEGGA